MVEIKFCGMTRREDAEFAASLGDSHYVGVIFAGGPRMLTVEQAMDVLAPVHVPSRAAVFGDQSVDEILRIADWLQLSVLQLHSGSTLDRIAKIRAEFDGMIWPVCRVAGAPLPPNVVDLAAMGDLLVLDSFVPGALGGTGVAMPWDALKPDVDRLRGNLGAFVLAGGLRPENVATAITTLRPGVVDVSSGVERAPGIKDHDRMRAFHEAVAALDES